MNTSSKILAIFAALSVSFASFAADAPKAKKTTSKKATHATQPAAPAPATHAATPARATKNYERKYGMAGCGLGTYVVGKNGSQILAATTNGTSYNQTFGITFGTLNCDDSDRMADVAQRMDTYVVANKVALASDIARGNGETISSLARLMNCGDSQALGSALQGNFSQVFPSHDVKANEVTDHIISVIVQDPSLSAGCKLSS